MDKNEIIFYLNIEDIQTVAIEVLDRELTAGEVEKIKDSICEKVNWYDPIYYSINEKIGF